MEGCGKYDETKEPPHPRTPHPHFPVQIPPMVYVLFIQRNTLNLVRVLKYKYMELVIQIVHGKSEVSW